MAPSPEKPPQSSAPRPGQQRPAPAPGGPPRRAAPGHATTPEPPPNPPSAPPPGIGLIGVGAILASMVLSGFLLGYWTDAWLDTRPLFMLIFAGLGLIGGILKVHKLLT